MELDLLILNYVIWNSKEPNIYNKSEKKQHTCKTRSSIYKIYYETILIKRYLVQEWVNKQIHQNEELEIDSNL